MENVNNEVKEDMRIIRTKRDLANSLEELLQERDFDDLSIKDITDNALISKNTFYNNFSDKGELLSFLLNRYKEELLECIDPVIKQYVYPFKKPIFKKGVEKVLIYLKTNKLPIKNMIKRDSSRTFYWTLTYFIRNFLTRVYEKAPKLFNSKLDKTDIVTFLAGVFTSYLYFNVLENKDIENNIDEISKTLTKLCSPILE